MERLDWKGINIGGWLMWEGYIMGGRNIPEKEFLKEFSEVNGKEETQKFSYLFKRKFIREDDFKNIKNIGFNSIRIPFHYKIIEKEEWRWIDTAIKWAKKNGLGVILDMHALPESQNGNWHSDGKEKPLFWKKKRNMERFIVLWKKIAKRYKGEKQIVAYDVINEPAVENDRLLADVYNKVIDEIRNIGDGHYIIVEGNYWATDFKFLKFLKKNKRIILGVHFYQPMNFVFNIKRDLKFPGKIDGEIWNRKKLRTILSNYLRLRDLHGYPIHIGEFGINVWGNRFSRGEGEWLDEIIDFSAKEGIGWSYWCYKKVATPVFPSAIYEYNENPFWLERGGDAPEGYERYIFYWKRFKRRIVKSWSTSEFSKHNILLGFFRSKLRQKNGKNRH